MSKELVTSQQTGSEILQKLVLSGDLSQMSGEQKVMYYRQFCESLGLNPLTEPFAILKLNGKEKLYAKKDAAEQLRKVHGISITDMTAEEGNGVYRVTAKAKDKDGKTDVSTGVVAIEGLKGETLANAMMKAETKAKRRVTLSIAGLGLLDETEIETIQDAVIVQPAPKQTISDKGFEKLLAKLSAPDANIDAIVKDTMEKLTLTDAQANQFTDKVAAIQTVNV